MTTGVIFSPRDPPMQITPSVSAIRGVRIIESKCFRPSGFVRPLIELHYTRHLYYIPTSYIINV